MKNLKRITSMFFLSLIFAIKLNAQPGFEDDINDVPMDGGISLVVLSAIGLGAINKLKIKK